MKHPAPPPTDPPFPSLNADVRFGHACIADRGGALPDRSDLDAIDILVLDAVDLGETSDETLVKFAANWTGLSRIETLLSFRRLAKANLTAHGFTTASK